MRTNVLGATWLSFWSWYLKFIDSVDIQGTNYWQIDSLAILLTLEPQNEHSALLLCYSSSWGWYPCHNQNQVSSDLYQSKLEPMYRDTVEVQQQNSWGSDHLLSNHCTTLHSILTHVCVPIEHWNTRPVEWVYSTVPCRYGGKTMNCSCMILHHKYLDQIWTLLNNYYLFVLK